MPRWAKQRTPSLSAPSWDGPAEWALWSVSLVLREISESQAADTKKKEPPCQAPAEDVPTSGAEESKPHESA